MASTHTTKITAKSEADYDAEYATKITVSGQDSGDVITIAPADSDVTLTIDKATAKMKLTNQDQVIWEEAESLKYDGTETVQTLKTKDEEYFYGGGQQNGFFSHKNRKILIENKSTWVSGGVSSPNPFYISTEGYGAMRNTFQPGSYDFSATAKMEHDENRFDAYYFVGDMKEVLGDYIELTGNPMFMPKYGFYQGNADCNNGEGEELLVDGINRAKEYQEHDMPVGWFLPNDGYGCGYGKSTDADENIDNLGKFVQEARNYGFVSGLWTENDLDKLDREVANGGTQMIKTDVAWVGDGYSFGLNAVRQAYEGIENNSDDRGFVVSLDGWAGTQRYAGLWSGDQTGGNWEYIRFHIPTYIGAGLSGNPNVGSDLDGIYGSGNIISTRDFQWKSFTPIEINMDGWTTGAEKNPWYHGEPYASINRMYLKMKTAFMPYNYTYAKQAHDTGVPMVRALVLEYPEDPFTWGNQTQYEYMWGENLLVAPVYQDTQMDENGNDVRNNIYLPDKDQIWIDYFTEEQYQGGQVINNFDAPLWKLPLFVKNGAILPKDVENNSQLFLNGDEDRIFEVYPAGTTTFDLYDDDGMSQDYKEGLGTMTHITSEAPEAGEKGDAVITVGKMSGTFEGMKSERGTQFIVNVSEKPETVTATIAGEEVTLKEVSSEAEFNEGTNVYYYNEAPDLNHYASEGSPFADQKIITTPKVMVKLAKTDITVNEVKLTVEGFVNAQEKAVNPDDPQLDAADVPIMEAETTDSSITLNWEMADDVKYGMIIDGNEDVVYRNVTAPFVHDSLNAAEEHTYQLVMYNTMDEVKGEVQRFATSEDRYKNVVKNTIGTASSQYGGNVGGYPASNAVDGDESSLWYTNWDDPIANDSDKIFTIDLRDAYTVNQLKYLNNGTAQIKDHEIQISLDGTHFKTVEKSVWEKPAEGDFRVFVPLGDQPARYVRIVSHDRHHNSANEFRVYKTDGTSAFNPANTQGDPNVIGDDDIKFLENYMGVTAENSRLWQQASPGDFNYNNEIDAYDLAFMMMQKDQVQPADHKAGGTLSLHADKTALKAGESVDITLQGTNLKDVYAFGLRLPIDMESINVSTTTTTAAEATADMRNLSRMPQNDDEYTVAFSMEGDAEGLNGTMSLATIRVSATVDTELDLSMADAFVVSDGLDLRTALPGSTVSGNVSQLEDVIHAFTLETAEYASDSLSAFNDALTNAKNVLNDASATQETMNAAMKDLFNATLDIQRSEPTRVAALQKVIDVLSEEAVKKDYTTSDLDKILATVSNAQSTVYYDNTPVSIDTAFASVVERLMSTEDASGSLQTSKDLIVDAMSAIVDELTDTYTAESLTALKQASDAFAAESAFDASGIVTGFNQLEVQVHTDTQILETVIDAAKAMDLESYDTESAEAALKTLREAEDLLGAEPTQAQVDEMLQKLVNAITNVMKTEVEAARDALQALISEAEAIDLSHKTTASREAFAQALEDAKAVLADENADAQALDEAYRNLQAAINGLQDIVDSDKSALEQAIADAKKVNTLLYTKETVDVFEQALKEAEAVMVDETATQDQVDAAAKKLIAAQNALQKNPETPADPQDPDEGKPGEGTDSDTAAASALPTTAAALIVSGAAAALMLRKRKHHI